MTWEITSWQPRCLPRRGQHSGSLSNASLCSAMPQFPLPALPHRCFSQVLIDATHLPRGYLCLTMIVVILFSWTPTLCTPTNPSNMLLLCMTGLSQDIINNPKQRWPSFLANAFLPMASATGKATMFWVWPQMTDPAAMREEVAVLSFFFKCMCSVIIQYKYVMCDNEIRIVRNLFT